MLLLEWLLPSHFAPPEHCFAGGIGMGQAVGPVAGAACARRLQPLPPAPTPVTSSQPSQLSANCPPGCCRFTPTHLDLHSLICSRPLRRSPRPQAVLWATWRPAARTCAWTRTSTLTTWCRLTTTRCWVRPALRPSYPMHQTACLLLAPPSTPPYSFPPAGLGKTGRRGRCAECRHSFSPLGPAGNVLQALQQAAPALLPLLQGS